MLLPKGEYRFSTIVSCDQRVFRGAHVPVQIKLWGGEERDFESTRLDAQHLELAQGFAIVSEVPEEILIQCQAQSHDMNVDFEFGSLQLRWLR